MSTTLCPVASNTVAALMVSEGAEVELATTRLERASKGHGLEVKGDGSKVSGDMCVFRDNTEAGAAVFRGGLMELVSCESERNKVAGFWSQNGGIMELTDCLNNNDEVGCGTRGEGSTATCQNVSVSCNSVGFMVIVGGIMVVQHCTVMGNISSGVSCSDFGSRFSMFGGQVKDCMESGVCAQDGCKVELKDVQISGNKLCSFIRNGSTTRMVLTRCMSTDEIPYMESDSAKLICRGCYPSDATDEASVFRKFKGLDIR